MHIHLVQSDIHWLEKDRNIESFLTLAKGVTPTEGDLIVAPELFSTGFSMEPERFAEPGDDGCPALDAVKSLAAETGSCVISGIATRASDGFANEALAAFPDGSNARYRKYQGFSPAGETEVYTPGTRLTTFGWSGGQIGLSVCYDLRFPSIYRELSFAGAELLVNIANWPKRRTDHWVKLLQARAIENQAYVAGVNRVGEDPNATYIGRSMLIDPQGGIVVDAGGEETAVSAEIDFQEVRRWRDEFPALKDARRGAVTVDHIR